MLAVAVDTWYKRRDRDSRLLTRQLFVLVLINIATISLKYVIQISAVVHAAVSIILLSTTIWVTYHMIRTVGKVW
jgi:hypothetical protein